MKWGTGEHLKVPCTPWSLQQRRAFIYNSKMSVGLEMTRVVNGPRRKHERWPDPSSEGPISEGTEHAKRGMTLQTACKQQSGCRNSHLRAFPSRFNEAVCCQPSPAGPVGQGRKVVSHAAASSLSAALEAACAARAYRRQLCDGRGAATLRHAASCPTQLLQRAAAARQLLYSETG